MLNHTLKLSLDDDRHLVVGDCHGRYDLFIRALEKANYDPAKDIVYGVGDMIDRGPDSVKMVEFFQQPRCYSVKGNHELMMMSSEWYDTWIDNGGLQCMDDLYKNNLDHDWMKDIIRPLPWVIDVGEQDDENAFRIVHAEMPNSWSEETFQRSLNMAISPDDPLFTPLVWSRRLVRAAEQNIKHLKPGHHLINFHQNRHRKVFTGHTPIQKAFKCKDHWFIDTWSSKSMTIIDAITEERFVAFL